MTRNYEAAITVDVSVNQSAPFGFPGWIRSRINDTSDGIFLFEPVMLHIRN